MSTRAYGIAVAVAGAILVALMVGSSAILSGFATGAATVVTEPDVSDCGGEQ